MGDKDLSAESISVGDDPRSAHRLWYFGYGSNMDPRTFLGRRGMRPSETTIGRLDDWALVFDLPVGPGERGAANLRPRRGASVWGVLYRISPVEAGRLDRSEGVPGGAYVRESVRVRTATGAEERAFSYRSRKGDPTRKPSRRYLGLLLAGAREHGLPPHYVESLRALELAVDERDAAQGILFDD